MNNQTLGLSIIVNAQIFGLVETIYFGNNWSPQTPAELICDALALMLTVYGFMVGLRA